MDKKIVTENGWSISPGSSRWWWVPLSWAGRRSWPSRRCPWPCCSSSQSFASQTRPWIGSKGCHEKIWFNTNQY